MYAGRDRGPVTHRCRRRDGRDAKNAPTRGRIAKQFSPRRIAFLHPLVESEDIRTLRVPADMRDGVLIANWRRPQAYLDPAVRACCSGLAQIDQHAVDAGIRRLRTDIADGTWDRRYGHLNTRTDYDGGYRLIIGEPKSTAPQ